MAERRMFAKTIIDSDAFIDMPMSARLLYYDLGMRADDDGFVNSPKKIMKFSGASDDDLRILSAKKFIIPFESGVVVIKHWKIHNYIRKDTYTETKYKGEKALLYTDENNAYSTTNPLLNSGEETPSTIRGRDVDEPSTQVRLGKVSLVKDSIEIADKPRKPRKVKIEFTPPTLDEVKAYIAEKGYSINPQTFYDYFTAGDPKWVDKNGSPVLNWKQKVVTWASRDKAKTPEQPKTKHFDYDENGKIVEVWR